MIIAVIAFILGIVLLLVGTDDLNPTRDLIGFVLIIASFIYVAFNSCA
jgi:hypothetical protein